MPSEQTMTALAIRRVTPTPEAEQLIERLVERHGPVAFFQFGGCKGVTACLTLAELYARAGRPTCVLDVEPGAAEGLALDGLDEFHFVTRASEADAAAQPA
jgi:uncharacterized protein (DUF779 family)